MDAVLKNPSSKVDVLVIGGGPAGLIAAVSAARNGARVALIEHYGFLGGNAAAGMLGNLCGFYTTGTKKDRIIDGPGWEIVQDLIKHGGALEILDDEGIGVIPYNHEMLKRTADKIVSREEIALFLHSLAVDAIIDGPAIKGVVIENKSGKQTIFAGVIVDATGDGDIAAKAGTEFEIMKQPQAMTMMFTMANVDTTKACKVQGLHLKNLMLEAVEKGLFTLPRHQGGFRIIPGMSGVVSCNMTRIRQANGSDVSDLTRAEIEGREQVDLYAGFLCQCVPGFEDAFIGGLAVQVGVRETRRIMGEYVLTEKDILGACRFPDAIGKNAWPVELHDPGDSGKDYWQRLPEGQSHDIPYRCLVPKKIDGLLVAGRCVSTTHIAQASIRVTGPCMAMGQAAGTAAAICVSEGINPREVNISQLQKTLRKQKAILR